jgi:hypothetical protein
MQQDRYRSHQLTKQGIVITGKQCEMTLSFNDLAQIIEALLRDQPTMPRQDIAVAGWSGGRQRDLLSLVRQEQPYATDL